RQPLAELKERIAANRKRRQGEYDRFRRGMSAPRIRCFVAMAFGRPDTDQWYKQTLEPLLRRHNISPRRVDLINHNDDVDDKILDELQKADMAIADLTYARPSAYFEAGYAIGSGRRVIFTCRSDHLKQGATDPHRIHFDLQMKNI